MNVPLASGSTITFRRNNCQGTSRLENDSQMQRRVQAAVTKLNGEQAAKPASDQRDLPDGRQGGGARARALSGGADAAAGGRRISRRACRGGTPWRGRRISHPRTTPASGRRFAMRTHSPGSCSAPCSRRTHRPTSRYSPRSMPTPPSLAPSCRPRSMAKVTPKVIPTPRAAPKVVPRKRPLGRRCPSQAAVPPRGTPGRCTSSHSSVCALRLRAARALPG